MKPVSAKLTRPRAEGAVSRERLFKKLDEAAGKNVLWISAPAGSGKTTLVASWLEQRKLPSLWYQADEGDADIATFFSYLGIAAKQAAPRFKTPLPLFTREYLSGIRAFTRRYCEMLFSRLKPPFCFVLDNYQDVPDDSQLHEVIREGLGMIPPGMTAIVISRLGPPALLSRLAADGRLVSIRPEDLAFTLEESHTLLSNRPGSEQSVEVVRALHDVTEGWAAGLVLLAAVGGAAKDAHRIMGTQDVEKVFHYFANEVFDKLESETRDFLLTSSFLPKMSVKTAEQMTGMDNAGRLLESLSRSNFFTVKHQAAEPSYQYHQLFRVFLLARMKGALNREDLKRVQNRAAVLLEGEGRFEDAAHLCIDAENWHGLSALVIHHALQLIGEGRFRTVEAWIDRIPPDMLEQNGWLLYWKASCRITARPADARALLEKAHALFLDKNDSSGSFLSWAGIVNTFVYEWRDFKPLDHWISEFPKLQQQYKGFPTPDVEERAIAAIFAAMMFR